MSKPLNVTVVEISEAKLYRLAGLTPTVEMEFEETFGRQPDADDYALGLARSVVMMRQLARCFEIKHDLDALPR